jgi:hypothetical protein|tara:strand:+ start:337366 stop:337839 length:474 start_codon:yes stop_codon:yes gene_type:complete
MKVSGPGPTRPTTGKGKVGDKSKDKGGQSFEISSGDETSASDNAAPINTTQQIAYVDTLLAVQGAEDPAQKASKGRMRQRAMGLIDELEKIRNALTLGNITVGHLLNIADVVASHRERIDDPQMTSILDEIDLRAQIEIAKMRYSLDRQESVDSQSA